jgi:hypothetical protein
MAVRWPFFAAAAILGGWLLLPYGAPLGAVLAGTGLAAIWNARNLRR